MTIQVLISCIYICVVYQAGAGCASWAYYRSLWPFNCRWKFGGYCCEVYY